MTPTSDSSVHRTVEDELNRRKKKTRLSVVSKTLLIVLKRVNGIAIGSVSIISEIIHSGINLVAAVIAYFSVKSQLNPWMISMLSGIGMALIIMKTAYDLTRKSLADLIDTRLPDREEERIRQIICEHCTDYSNFHDLRTRRSGPERFIDLHLVVLKDLSVLQDHDIADHP